MPTWETAFAELVHLCGQADAELDAQTFAARLGAIRPGAVVAPLADVLVVERAIGRLLSLGWRGSVGGLTLHRLLYDLARWADHDDPTAKRLLRHALEFPASPLQRKLTRQRLRRVVEHPRRLSR